MGIWMYIKEREREEYTHNLLIIINILITDAMLKFNIYAIILKICLKVIYNSKK